MNKRRLKKAMGKYCGRFDESIAVTPREHIAIGNYFGFTSLHAGRPGFKEVR